MTLFGVHYRMEGESAEKDSVWCIKRSRRFLLTLSLSEIAKYDWPKFISFRFSEKLIKLPKLQEMRWLPEAAPPDPPEEAQRALRPPSSCITRYWRVCERQRRSFNFSPPQCFAGSAAPGITTLNVTIASHSCLELLECTLENSHVNQTH